ncbi:MAG: sugar ABC transporter permease [Planctomycetota bacterium]|nr:sugar ABC transporter permease [Planctomycetota bacterium]
MNSRRVHHPLTPLAFLAPALLVLGTFSLAAMVQVAWYSLTKYTAFQGPVFVGLDNYRRLLATDRFWLCLVNSAVYLLVTPVIIAVSLGASIIVDARLKATGWLRLVLFLPVVTPTIVAAMAFRLLFNEDAGLLNRGLMALGVTDEPVRWLSQQPWTLMTAMLVTVWKGFGFYMMVFLSALAAVPRELKEAAALDGAGRWRSFTSVTLPAIWPAVVLVFLVSSISALKVFDELYVTIKGAPITHQTVVPLIYQVAFEEGNYGMASAIGVALFVAILAFSLVNLRLSQRREKGAKA